MSSGWLPDMLTKVEQRPTFLDDLKQAPLDLIWFGCGRGDRLAFQNTRAMAAFFERAGIPMIWRETKGGHRWPCWRASLAEVAPLLFRT